MINSEIRLENVQVLDLNLTASSSTTKDTARSEFETSIGFSLNFDYDSPWFGVTFELEILNEAKTFCLKTKVLAIFETKETIDEEFQHSSFVKVNAPAIAFPYVRAFISNFMLNAGYDPIILPSYNFFKLSEEMEHKR